MTPSVGTPSPEAQANALLNRGDFAAAGEAYARLSGGAAEPQHSRYTALAALAFQDANDFSRADQLLASIQTEDAQASRVANVAKARSMLSTGFAADALAQAQSIDHGPLTPYQKGAHTRVIGLAAVATGDDKVGGPALVEAYRYPVPETRAAALSKSTWQAVSRLSVADLTTRAASSDAVAAGWYELALTAHRSLFDRDAFQGEADNWLTRFPNHPAQTVLEGLRVRAETTTSAPRQIALLLPFDDALGAAAAAIRDGFLTAWYADRQLGSRPRVNVYSSAQADIGTQYRKAIAAGAEIIVGPLRKSHIKRLGQEAELLVSILALNVIQDEDAGGAPLSVYQFGLQPEDEAFQVARRARAFGQRALIIAPDSAWGKRLMTTYRERWIDLAGEVLAEVYFSSDAEAYADSVKRALNVDLSEARTAGLKRVLRMPVEYEHRRRGDIDVILLAASAANARQILPQLRYYRVESIPIFATSHSYTGVADPDRDHDLNGLIFADMPWLFGATDVDSFNQIRRGWPDQIRSLGRLYGFGIDAYRLIPYLAKMRFYGDMRIPGVTGTLWMDRAGVVHREMTWLRFDDGIPVLLDALDLPVGG